MKIIKTKSRNTVIVLVILFSQSLLRVGFASEDAIQENVANFVRDNDNIALVAVYRSRWVPPASKTEIVGRIFNMSRVVKVYKGSLKLGDKVVFKNFIENPPGWVKKYERSEEADLYYIFFSSDNVVVGSLIYNIEGDSQRTFSINDSSYAEPIASHLARIRR